VIYTVLMSVGGVLRAPVGGQPIREGVALYHALAASLNLVLLDDDGQDEDWENFAHVQGLDRHTTVVPWVAGHDRVDQCETIRRGGYSVAFVIDPDPRVCADLLMHGFNSVLFTHAEYAHPSWRPDANIRPRPWADISAQVAENARLRLADARGDA
jgi:hypothetical protein